ncbi:MAG: hypothetical protein OXC31_26645 [Spirochaetaceae bacterium]|nr:hypothetical protein [Spirochaetaceae bacterium]
MATNTHVSLREKRAQEGLEAAFKAMAEDDHALLPSVIGATLIVTHQHRDASNAIEVQTATTLTFDNLIDTLRIALGQVPPELRAAHSEDEAQGELDVSSGWAPPL